MKKKLLLSLIGCSMSVLVLASCAGTSSQITNLSLSSNWLKNTTYKEFQQSMLAGGRETLTYKVESTSSSNSKYEYIVDNENNNSRLITTFEIGEYDYTKTDLPEEYEDSYKMDICDLYYFKYDLLVEGKYVYKPTGEEVAFSDFVMQEVYFKNVKDGMLPVYSTRKVCSTSPKSSSPKSAEEMCENVFYTYSTWYNEDSYLVVKEYEEYTNGANEDSAPIVNTKTDVNEYNDLKKQSYTVYDNAEILVLMRALALSDGSSAYTSLNVAESGIGNYAIGGNAESEVTDADTLEMLKNAKYLKDGDKLTEVQTTLSMVDTKMTGASQVFYYAKVMDSSYNTARSVLLSMKSNVAYNLGTLTYTLTSISSTFTD